MAGDRPLNVYKEIKDGKHPTIGTRVEKGDDWMWGNQNNGENGTIVGHANDTDDGQCWVQVEWDDQYSPEKGIQNVYRYKMDDTMAEDVREAEIKDRIPPKGYVLAVGCRVKQGEGFIGDKTYMQGTVIRFKGILVEVRWDNGTRGKYRFGYISSEVVPVMDQGRKVRRKSITSNLTFCTIPNLKMNDKLIGLIASTIGNDWQLFDEELAVKREHVTDIAEENPDEIIKQKTAMLNVWKEKVVNPTLDVLVKAILVSGVTIDIDELSRIVTAAKEGKEI